MGGLRGGGRGAGGEVWAVAVAWVEVRTGLEPQRTPALFGQPTPTPCVRLFLREEERAVCLMPRKQPRGGQAYNLGLHDA